jgi:TrmH family RNA methyltransferase
MSTTLGAHSPKLEAARALRTKAGRTGLGRFAIEGATMLAEALAAGRRPESLFVTERGAAALPDDQAELLDGRTYLIPERAMERLSELETPPGILAVLPLDLPALESVLDGEPAILLAGVSDPGNAGTLLRTAEIFGTTRALFTSDSVEPHNPKVVRATMGALFRMRIASAAGGEIGRAAARAGYTVVAAAREGLALPDFRFPERTLLAIGNERHGVARSMPGWDRAVSIPQTGRGESLNAAVAGAILLYVFSQQRAEGNPRS